MRRAQMLFQIFVLGVCCAALSRAQGAAFMVKDINTTAAGGSSYPQNLTDVNGTLFFSANDGVNGTELWKSDGTDAGTVMVKDINPGAGSSSPGAMANLNGTLLFFA